ncbi:DUF4129 domain-containing protein [Natrinema sp. 1APR25-10V2]|uniref:DUF4129 domain-containing protein n=1 Tax=Natrinema sp. 1APR25-10V2 TaxID=2951081 RepID=UPI0028752018|nr:DUF4129 domain-containing protein [Natrinema sp. 1APR25-10V2]MDS0476755.1 DUF4129 domain-containing protein [Natrinema sp. 1APR25-10V2]
MSEDSTPDDASAADYRQLSFVALAAVALVLAAAFAPGAAVPAGSESGGDGSGPRLEPGGSDGGDGPNVDFDWKRLLELLNIDRGEGNGEQTETETETACVIALDRTPVPGGQVTATIRYEGELLVDAPVWFNGQHVGRTDEYGQVTDEVPYVKELRIRVGAESDVTCRAGASTAREGVAVGAGSGQSVGTTATGATAGTLVATRAADGIAAAQAAADGEDETGNATGSYEVTGEIEIGVCGDPYPGEEITVDAVIEGIPMREATVSIDGTAVGRTGDDGTATVTVPDDGSERITLEVARGDFSGTKTVDVLLLEAHLRPAGLAPVPGSPGAVAAEIDGEPVANATVTVGGERAGTTDADGRLSLALPRDPTTTVTVSTGDRTANQTASVTLLGAYGGPAAVATLVVAGLAAFAYRTHGRRGPLTVVGAAAALLAVLVVEAFYGPWAGLAALAVVALLGFGLAVGRSGGQRLRDREVSPIREALGRFAAWIVERAMRVVDRLEALVDRGRALAAAVRAWLRSLPRSASGLWTRLADWLRTCPARVRSGLRRALVAARTLPLRTVAIGIGALAVLGGGYAVDGLRGAALVAGGLAVAGVLRRRSAEPDSTKTGGDTDDSGESTTPEPTANTGDEDRRRSFRELWRAFARRVSPGRWRTRTPGEIERRALSDGYPREPVRELTTLFREVEYGGRPRSSERRDRAAAAYDEIEAEHDRERKGEAAADSPATESASGTDGGEVS